MTNEEIIKKAIEKVIKNGFEEKYIGNLRIVNDYGYKLELMELAQYGGGYDPIDYDETTIYQLIYNKDFAKAFWGEEEHTFISIANFKDESNIILDFHGAIIPNCKWQFHLQQMVLSKDPIKYLEDYV